MRKNHMIKNILKLVFKFLLQRLFNYFGIILNDSGVSFMLDLLNEIFSEVISKKLIIIYNKFKERIKNYIIKQATENCSYCYC